MAASQILGALALSIYQVLEQLHTLLILETLAVLDHGTYPLILHHQPQLLNRVQRTAVCR
jgi:hypothetical protein